MQADYNPQKIEAEVQAFWEAEDFFAIESEETPPQKFYVLGAFPYPSGELHVGHVRNYVLGDVIARYQRANKKQVLYPIGWDAFGLPAENAAIAQNIDPSDWTYQNIKRMQIQLKRLGLSYDWNRELMTCDPNYYQWEQAFFIKLFEKGFAYRKTSWVNWDPVDQTILANEQVIQGRGWRSNALIERKAIPQWFLKITHYTEALLHDLDTLQEWPDAVKTMQRHWIGRSKGVIVKFKLLNTPHFDHIEVFTTRVDTLMGVSYIAISFEHPLTQKAAQKNSVIQLFINQCLNTATSEEDIKTQEKVGIFAGFYVEHPISKIHLPVWIANFVDMDYGTGAIMAVPAHDMRDFEFAKRYKLPIQRVISPKKEMTESFTETVDTQTGFLINSGPFTGLHTKDAIQGITEHLIAHNLGHFKTQYRLKDWGVSRQRYWGAPIPIIYCKKCGTVPVPLKDLPVQLPKITQCDPGKAPPPLSQIPEFYQTQCPSCKGPAKRETDTFDTFFESSWYFVRFLCPKADKMIDPKIQNWLPVDHYIIGIEHAILHLLYARFFYKLFHTLGLLKTSEKTTKEPFKALLTLGMVLKEGAKMSKSKGNVVNPTTLIEQYGADALRLFILFAAPPTQSLEWSDTGLLGAHRFLKKLWTFVNDYQSKLNTQLSVTPSFNATQKNIRFEIHTLLESALQDYKRYQFNTVVSSCMKLLNILQNAASTLDLNASQNDHDAWVIEEGLNILLHLLAPIVPHITQALWIKLDKQNVFSTISWPTVDKTALSVNEMTVVVQINGKKRDTLSVKKNTPLEKIKQAVFQMEKIRARLSKAAIQKIIIPKVKPNASLLINIVTTS